MLSDGRRERHPGHRVGGGAGAAWARGAFYQLRTAIPVAGIFGGEDAGSYLNSSISYLREGKIDGAAVLVPEATARGASNARDD